MIMTSSRSLRALLVSVLLAGMGGVSGAGEVTLLRERAAAARPQCLVIGTVHLANPGRDVSNVTVDDMLTAERQREIEKVTDRLAAFRPTHLAVEWPAAEQAKLDQRYRDYRAGTYRLSADEVDQIGLRLAARLGLERLDAVDWNEMPPGSIEDFDWETWAAQHGQQALLDAIREPHRSQAEATLFRRSTLLASLRELNRPEALTDSNRKYFDYALLGDQTHHPGANWVANWYGRNLKIFANLVRRAAKPTDRLLVLYGAGHAFLLRQFATQSGAFAVVDAERYLTP